MLLIYLHIFRLRFDSSCYCDVIWGQIIGIDADMRFEQCDVGGARGYELLQA